MMASHKTMFSFLIGFHICIINETKRVLPWTVSWVYSHSWHPLFRQLRVGGCDVVIVINILRVCSYFLQLHPWSQPVFRSLHSAGDGDLTNGSGRSVRWGDCVSVQVVVGCLFAPLLRRGSAVSVAAEIKRHLFVQVSQFAVVRERPVWKRKSSGKSGHFGTAGAEVGPEGERLNFPLDALRLVRSKSENKKSKLYTFLQILVVHLLVHVENAQDAAQDGLLGLLGTDPLPGRGAARCRGGQQPPWGFWRRSCTADGC